MGLPAEPKQFEPLEGVRDVDTDPTGLRRVRDLMGNQGLVGVEHILPGTHQCGGYL
ncbi:MAG: hypothetical protein KAR19_19270 [Bacteroidales bacterium]|nr:hypothetical protein [Bacteroidales bacterium]